MTSLEINGIKVHFPYEPYSIQKDYMKKVIESLQTSSHAILESPTGTGKTLSLLCSSLAWLMNEKLKHAATMNSNVYTLPDEKESYSQAISSNHSWGTPKIIYSSRTHSQLSQAVQELKQTIYKDTVKASIIGSRDQLCLKREVLDETSHVAQVNICRSLVKQRACSYHYGVEKQRDLIMNKNTVVDIEDLVQFGRKHHFCPYYMAREFKETADLIFMPYNYLLDPNLRKTFGIQLNNTVIILDEAHNVEKICEESASVAITSTDIAMAIEELTHIMKAMEKPDSFMFESEESKDFTLDDLVVIKSLFLKFEKVVSDVEVKSEQGDTYDGLFLQQLLEKSDINVSNRQYTMQVLDKLIEYLTTAQTAQAVNRNGQYLQRFKDLLSMIHENDTDMLQNKVKKCFRVFIQEQVINKDNKKGGWLSKIKEKKQKILNYWCFSPSFGMEKLVQIGVRNIILTSGTLAPIKPLISELGLDAPIQLENPHIVSKDQLLVKIVSNGYQNIQMDSSFKNRENKSYIHSLGFYIKAVSKMIPGGLLVFFPSYPVMNTCTEAWQESGIWSDICKEKPIFIEPRKKDDFNDVMNKYYAQINLPQSKGACFFAVCRGKVSEGLDFADENGRGVIITGLPFPPTRDPRVILKRKYLDMHATMQNQMVNGQKWYTLEAVRAVNQAIGRVIRHKNDYGVILLCDYRFANTNLRADLSKWLRDYIITTNTFAQAIQGITRFFHVAQMQFPTKNKLSIEGAEETPNTSQISYNKDETAFGTVVPKTTTYSCIQQEKENSEKSIFEDYKCRSKEPISTNVLATNKKTFSVFEMDSNTQKPSFSLVLPTAQTSSAKVSELNPSKKRKINLIYSIDGNADNRQSEVVESLKTVSNSTAVNIVEKVKNNFKPAEIKMFLQSITDYKKGDDIYKFIEGIHECFKDRTDSDDFLNDILTFVKIGKDRHLFGCYINLRKKWDLFTPEERKKHNYNNFLFKK